MTTRPPTRRRREATVAIALAVAVLAVLAVRALDSPSRLDYYRIVDDRTLVVGTDVGPGSWTRVTSIVETPSTITIAVGSFLIQPGPGAAEAVPLELTVDLGDPISARTVVDASTGVAIPGTRCSPPAYLAAGCTP
jgi:hypothetical protein